ncbi:DUF2383 domain-containing protein [Rhodovulum marinum]|uniref:Uncharacterized protein DUF2383 n=1 Tax=Rhodovulum marinum TaxID=320662 RepID=A0A4R2Q5P4_9RHOB|nr:DUF2383 domain-containing protein [Rhodovulum marinum]TCP43274.1 uncharacterized protein DUF2383 [Rhodovulum marinum]
MQTETTITLDDDARDALATAHTRTVDVLAGHEKMVEKAEAPFRPTAIRFRDLHRRHARSLAALLLGAGCDPDEDGSFMAHVNRLVVGTRALLDEIDKNTMDQIRSGEETVIKAFEAAEKADLPVPLRQEVTRMRQELQALLADTGHIG